MRTAMIGLPLAAMAWLAAGTPPASAGPLSVDSLTVGYYANPNPERIAQQKGWFDEARRGWMFKQGRELTFAPESGELIGSKPFAERFEPRYREEPDLMLLIDRKPS